MKLAKVHYSRREYAEYLQTDEWAKLRTKALMHAGYECERCGVVAKDVHHTKYRHIVDVRPKDLIAVCRDCHDLLHSAVRVGLLSKKHSREQALALPVEAMKARRKRIAVKVALTTEDVEAIKALSPDGKKRVLGIMRCLPPLDWSNVVGRKVTRNQLDKIRWTIRTFAHDGSFQDRPHYRNAKRNRNENRRRGRPGRYAKGCRSTQTHSLPRL